MAKIRYAVVGAGWISQIAFMPSVAQTGNSEMTAIVTGNADKARQLADFYGIENVYSYDQYDEMLAGDVVDAVYIALPNSMHADYAIRALNAGKHALVEKPLATTIAESEAMIKAANDNNALLMTAYRLHTEPATVELIERLHEGAIGEVKHFASTFSFQSDPGNHRLQAEHWGGPFQDIGVYCLNAARHVFRDEPTHVMAMKTHGQGDPRFTEVEGSMAVTLMFPRKRMAQFLISFEAGSTDMFRVMGTEGQITMEPAFEFQTTPKFRIIRDDGNNEDLTFPDSDHFGGQTAYFSDCILNGTQPESDGEEGLADMHALLAMERAAKTGEMQEIHAKSRTKHPTRDMVRIVPRTDKRLVF
ncbi:MAG: Gfo/Idh/MocA family oxidoreductase [Silicimonas sp.]|nr:Gfo/Idh/MocA family oxidoreductase [Silicimonas sp.]